MKTTKQIPILIEKDNQYPLEDLDRLMAVFCSTIRYSFNRLLGGENKGDLVKKVNVQFHLNKRYAEDAVMLAEGTISSQKVLLPSRIENVQRKIEKTEQKIEAYQTGKKTPKNVSLEICLKGLNARLVKLQKKKSELVTIQEEGSISTVIFGGKKNFYNRMKNKISYQYALFSWVSIEKREFKHEDRI
ncbi:transposase [Oceanobacillus halophilus]|uniref:transposase n=1 Tax=Oceanobacillus halophilus TaxID=930130 RepID=UPI001F4DBE5C|nr:transposase [Oceanobacillus halophilus]